MIEIYMAWVKLEYYIMHSVANMEICQIIYVLDQ